MPNPIKKQRERNIAKKNMIKDIRNLFMLKKKKRQSIVRHKNTIWTRRRLLWTSKIGKAFSSNYIEYKSNGDKDKMLSTEDYL